MENAKISRCHQLRVRTTWVPRHCNPSNPKNDLFYHPIIFYLTTNHVNELIFGFVSSLTCSSIIIIIIIKMKIILLTSRIRVGGGGGGGVEGENQKKKMKIKKKK